MGWFDHCHGRCRELHGEVDLMWKGMENEGGNERVMMERVKRVKRLYLYSCIANLLKSIRLTDI